MPQGLLSPARTLRPLLAALLVASGAAFADDYADVTRMLRSGQHAQALERADQYLAAKPRDPQMRFLKGVILGDAGRTAEAAAIYTSLTQEYPELPEPHNNLAVIHASRNELDQARASLETALRANPAYATAQENLGDVYLRLAIQSWARAQQLDVSVGRSVAPKLAAARSLAEGSRPATSVRPASR